ncbi:unnamed protein product [Chironomus riparius]|uniref:Peptidase S1 domain-containing protein n=1 Tax=Chironomus riparius TaxID=315576 RepID=A0A9N9RJ03_9DIPT|nr:unnamed protein product [Chironomus riparius]
MNTLKKISLILFLSTTYSKPQQNSFLIGTKCITRANETGVCKYYKNCHHLAEKVRNRIVKQEDIFKCDSQGVICCTPDVPTTTTRIINNYAIRFQSRIGIKGKISKEKCREYSKYTKKITHIAGTSSNPEPIATITDKCQHNYIQLVVGGKSAHQHEFPHQAHIGYKTQTGIEWSCGGSLVSSNYVLTAAHCNDSKHNGKIKFIKLGMIDRLQNDNNVFIYNVTKVIKHPQYSPRTFNNDIALLKLENDVNFSEFIYPICLPTRQHNEPNVILTGLGKTGGSDEQSQKLMKVELRKFSNKECQEIIETINITRNMMCYGSRVEQKDSCGGDSGGPIQILNDRESYCTYKLIGIVSFGYANCGMIGVPGVYVNVYNYLSWIEDIVWNNAR